MARYCFIQNDTGVVISTTDSPEPIEFVRETSGYDKNRYTVLEANANVGDIIHGNGTVTRHSTIEDVANAIHSGASDSEIDNIISNVASVAAGRETASEFRKRNYFALRSISYPSSNIFIDAYVKSSSDDISVRVVGEGQMREYINECLLVKKRFPKPDGE